MWWRAGSTIKTGSHNDCMLCHVVIIMIREVTSEAASFMPGQTLLTSLSPDQPPYGLSSIIWRESESNRSGGGIVKVICARQNVSAGIDPFAVTPFYCRGRHWARDAPP